jgi:hypothetical protein
MEEQSFGEMAYRALAVEGWDTEELLAAEADPMWVAEARAWAAEAGEVFPPESVGRDFAGSIIAAYFGW